MTRFARARGSKSSNERAPEDSTPWEVMKEQLMQAKKDGEESKKREQAEKQRIENYEKFLKDHKTQKRKSTWCDFPESQISILSKSDQASEPVKKKNKKQHSTTEESTHGQTSQHVVSDTQQSKKKLKMKKLKNTIASNTNPEVQPNVVVENSPNNESKKEKKKHKRNINVSSKDLVEQGNNATEDSNSKYKGKNNKKQKVSEDGKTQEDSQQNSNKIKGNEGQNNKPPKQKKKKLMNGEHARRKPVNDNYFQIIINGKEIELVRFDGFPIMKKDAERLQELKTNMIKKGIPKSEVQRTMKLERRRAEKALARVKKDVCYNCRKGGHNLSDCPELKSKLPGAGAPDGLCFKCGSTEHRQFECKVQRDKEFRFATCFICKEPGHIARQCPDNPKGLYPNGGSCKLCGDVTHLRKDCPTVQDKREDSSIKLQTLDSEELEAIPQKNLKSTGPEESVVKKPKKIKF